MCKNLRYLGESNAILARFYNALQSVAGRNDDFPLLLWDFLERLDEAVDIRPILQALNATGRQVFIAVPHYYEIKTGEKMPYVTIIRTF